MPRLPTMRVIGSQAISTSRESLFVAVLLSVVVIAFSVLSMEQGQGRHLGSNPVVSASSSCRHLGSWLRVRLVIPRSRRITAPYGLIASDDRLAPGGMSMKGMNLSGKPGMVHPMQTPPTFGQPPTPFIQPRLGTSQFTTGPQQPILTWHFGEL